MLSPEQLDRAGDAVAAVYSDIEAQMLDRLVATLCDGETLRQRDLTALVLTSQTHARELRGVLDANAGSVDAAARDTVTRMLRASDEDDMRRAGGPPMYPQQVEGTVQGVARILARDNIQMLEGAKQAFLGASTKAITQVNTGALTTEQALHRAVRELERAGIPVITYQNSRTGMVTVQNKVDVAVRRHIRTQIAQDGARMTLERLESLGVELVEVSSHEDARPSHAAWQGRVYSLHGDMRMPDGTFYPDFYSSTNYGAVDGLCGANCRHSFGPYRHGAPRAYEPDPKHESGLPNEEVYEMEQRQRHLERQIRQAKREVRGAQQVHDSLGTIESRAELAKAQQRLKRSQASMREFIEESNAKSKTGAPILHRHANREWAGDMPKSPAVKTSGRTLGEFMGGAQAARDMQARGISKTRAAAAMRGALEQRGIKTADFTALTASEQQSIWRGVLDLLPSNKRATAKAGAGKHASTPHRFEQGLQGKGLADEHVGKISRIAAGCKDAAARKAFEDGLSELSFDSTAPSANVAHYSPTTHGLTLNMDATARGFAHRPDKAEYQTFFHEYAHYIDHRSTGYGDEVIGGGRRRYRVAKYASHKGGIGATAEQEVRGLLNGIKKREGYGTIAEAKAHLTREIEALYQADKSSIGGLSDIIHGATNGTCCDTWFLPKHAKSYWTRSKGGLGNLSTETFAHFYETTMANPAALETLKKYLPATYNAFLSVLKGM